jgi:hypothetical protein
MTTDGNGTQEAGSEAGPETLPGARLAEELRLLLDALAERAEPWLHRLAQAPDGEQAGHTPATCGWCPLCAGLAVLRGERPELAQKAAEHTAGLLTVLRSALADHESAPPAEQPPAESTQRVQHIAVRRSDGGDAEC